MSSLPTLTGSGSGCGGGEGVRGASLGGLGGGGGGVGSCVHEHFLILGSWNENSLWLLIQLTPPSTYHIFMSCFLVH